MSELIFEPGKIYEFAEIDNLRVFLRVKYLETVFNPINKEIRLHFHKLESSVEEQKDIYLSPSDICQQVGSINEAREYEVTYEY